MSGLRLTLTTLTLLIALVTAAPAADVISGVPYIVDGDTLSIGNLKIRLEGIDAPETDQICLDQNAATWTCGVVVRDRLAERVGKHSIDCTPRGTDRYGRTLAVCSLAGEDLNAWMVRRGLALAFIRYSRAYTAEEEQARDAKRGLWSGAFIAPWDWLHRNCKTVILGAVTVPMTAQAQLCGSACAIGAPSPNCTIKGNVNRKVSASIISRIATTTAASIWLSRANAGSVPSMRQRLPDGDRQFISVPR